MKSLKPNQLATYYIVLKQWWASVTVHWAGERCPISQWNHQIPVGKPITTSLEWELRCVSSCCVKKFPLFTVIERIFFFFWIRSYDIGQEYTSTQRFKRYCAFLLWKWCQYMLKHWGKIKPALHLLWPPSDFTRWATRSTRIYCAVSTEERRQPAAPRAVRAAHSVVVVVVVVRPTKKSVASIRLDVNDVAIKTVAKCSISVRVASASS